MVRKAVRLRKARPLAGSPLRVAGLQQPALLYAIEAGIDGGSLAHFIWTGREGAVLRTKLERP
jgi:hypothetical protein